MMISAINHILSRSGGMADATDSKSVVPKGRVGSSPTFGISFRSAIRNSLNNRWLRIAVFNSPGHWDKKWDKSGLSQVVSTLPVSNWRAERTRARDSPLPVLNPRSNKSARALLP